MPLSLSTRHKWINVGLLVLAAILLNILSRMDYSAPVWFCCGVPLVFVIALGYPFIINHWQQSTPHQPARYRQAQVIGVLYASLLLLTAMYMLISYLRDPKYPLPGWAVLMFVVIGVMAGLGSLIFFNHHAGRRLSQSSMFKGVSVLLMSLIVMLVLAEITLRTPFVRDHLTGYHPSTILSRQPRQHLGAADYVASEEAPDKIRVLILGDSITFGSGLRQPTDRYADILQTLASDRFEIIVLAQPGASTRSQIALWRTYGHTLDPDLVIVGVVTNDPDMGYLQQVETALFSRLMPQSQLMYLLDYLNIVNGWIRLEGGYPYSEWEANLYTHAPTQVRWRVAVHQLYDEITASGAEAWAYILASPTIAATHTELFQQQHAMFTILEATFKAGGFRTVNMFDASLARFGSANGKRYCAQINDCHPGVAFHRFYAALIWADLQDYP